MRILITTLLLCISAVLFAQVPTSFQGTLNIYQSSGTSPNYEIRGVFNDTQGRYTADSADVGDKIFILDGANCVELEITSIISTTGGILRCNVTDVDAVLVNPPLATGAIMEPTPNYGFPTFVDGISNDLLACIRTHFTLLVDNISSGGGGGITGVPGNTQDTVVQTGHGLSLLDPVFVNTSGNWILSNISDEDSCHMAIVTEVISADTLIITYNGLTTQPGHGYTVGSVYFVQDDGTYATTVPTNFINDIAFYVVSDSTLYITEQRIVSPMTDLNGIYSTSDTIPDGTIATGDEFKIQGKTNTNYEFGFWPSNDNIYIKSDSVLLTFSSSEAVFRDYKTVPTGIEYNDSGYVTNPLSLTTKEYVDNTIAAIPTDNIYTADGTTTDANRVVEVINNISFVDTLTNEFGVKITTPLFSEEVAIGRLDATSGTKATLSESKNNIELRGNATDPLKLAFLEETAQGTNFSVIRARDTLSSNTDFILPNSNGSYAQVLTTDGQGRTAWDYIDSGNIQDSTITTADLAFTPLQGSGTSGRIPRYTSANTLSDGVLRDDGTLLALGGATVSGYSFYDYSTGGWRLATGTTAQRPTNIAGLLRYNTSLGYSETANGSAWLQSDFPAGTTNYTIRHDGTSWVSNSLLQSSSSLVWINNATAPPNGQTFGVAGNVIVGSAQGHYLQIGGENGSLGYTFNNTSTNGVGRFTATGGFLSYSGSVFSFTNSARFTGSNLFLRFSSAQQLQSINQRIGAIIGEINTQGTRIFQWNLAESTLSDANGNLTPFYVGLPARYIRSSLGNQNGTILGALFRQVITADTSTVTPSLVAMGIEPTFSNNGLTNVNKYGIRYRATTTGTHYAATFNSGLVGIGTETPAQTLHVDGTMRLTGSDGTATALMGRDADGDISAVSEGYGINVTGGALEVDTTQIATQSDLASVSVTTLYNGDGTIATDRTVTIAPDYLFKIRAADTYSSNGYLNFGTLNVDERFGFDFYDVNGTSSGRINSYYDIGSTSKNQLTIENVNSTELGRILMTHDGSEEELLILNKNGADTTLIRMNSIGTTIQDDNTIYVNSPNTQFTGSGFDVLASTSAVFTTPATQFTGTLRFDTDGSTATSIVGQDASNKLTDVALGYGLDLTTGTLLVDSLEFATQYDLSLVSGTTNLTFSGASSPVTLNSSSGTDVTFTAGAGVGLTGTGTDLTIAATDASISNEGSLTVGAGGGNSSTIVSNTSGSTAVTISGGTGITVTEAGSTITVANSGDTNAADDITGTVAAGQVPYATGDNVVAGTSSLTWNNTNTGLSIISQTLTGSRGLNIRQHSTDIGGGAAAFVKSRGTFASQTAVASGDIIGAFVYKGYSGTQYLSDNALFGASATGTITTTSVPTSLFFISGATTNYSPDLLIHSGGNIGIGSSGTGDITGTINTPPRTATIYGEMRVTDLTTDAPTQVVGADADGDFGALALSGLSIAAGTLTATDGSTSNELQTVNNTSDATSHTVTLSNSGGSIKLVEGSNITLTTTGTAGDGIVTIASTGGGATDLTFTGASSPYTLNSSTGTDVTFTEGEGIDILRSSNNLTISASVMTAATGGSAGAAGIVPQPSAGENVEFLRGDATWAVVEYTKNATIENPGSSENVTLFYTRRAITIREIADVVRGTSPSVTWQIKYATTRDSGSPTDLFSASRTTTSTSGATTTTFNDATIGAGNWIWLVTSATSGTNDELSVTLTYTID